LLPPNGLCKRLIGEFLSFISEWMDFISEFLYFISEWMDVIGESHFKTGIIFLAAVLFKIALVTTALTAAGTFHAFSEFIKVALGGILVGCVSGFLTLRITRHRPTFN
jgi:hypothetical protein